MDIVKLLFQADTSQLDQASKKLEGVGSAAGQAQTKGKGLKDTFDELGKVGGPIGDAADKVSGLASRAGDAVGGLGRLAGGALLVGTAIAAAAVSVVKLTFSIADMADELNDLANCTNISTERLSLLDAAAKMAGSSAEELVSSAERLGAKLAKQDEETGKTANALKELGVSTKDANGETKSMLQLQEEVVLAVDKATDKAKAEGQALAILGTDYYKLRTAIKETHAQKSEMYDYMASTGSLVTTKLAKDSDELNDKIGQMGLAFKGMGMSIASVVLPYLNGVVGKIGEIAAAAADLIRRYTGGETNTEIASGALSKLMKERSDLESSLSKMEGSAFGSTAQGAKAIQQAKERIDLINEQTRHMNRLKASAITAAAAVKKATIDGAAAEGNRVVAGSGSPDKPPRKTKTPKDKTVKDPRLTAEQIRQKQLEGRQAYIDDQVAIDTQAAEFRKKEESDLAKLAEQRTRYNEQLTQTADRYRAFIDPNFTIIEQLKEVNRLQEEGALTSAEASQARTLLQSQIISEQQTFVDGWKNAFTQYQANAYTASMAGADAFNVATSAMEQGINQFVTTGKLNFKDFARSAIASIVQIYAKMVATKLVGMIAGAFSGGAGAGVQMSGTASIGNMAANGAVYGSSGLLKSANGNVFDGATLHRYGSNKLGVLGEAGPEAVMPLKRGANGQLGVQVTGGSSSGGPVAVSFGDIVIQGGSSDEETAANMLKTLKEKVVPLIRQTIQTEKRTGGLLAS